MLSLDDVPESIACRVLEVDGPVSRLAYRDELPPLAVGRLVVGSEGYLVFDEFRAAVGLRVAVRTRPPYLDATIIERTNERRGGDRVKLVTRARIIHEEDDGEQPPVSTYTVDLSERGALIRNHAALEGRQRFTLEIMFGDDPQPITAQARIVRQIEGAVGIEFESITSDDAKRLGGYLMGIQQQRARRGA